MCLKGIYWIFSKMVHFVLPAVEHQVGAPWMPHWVGYVQKTGARGRGGQESHVYAKPNCRRVPWVLGNGLVLGYEPQFWREAGLVSNLQLTA